MFYAFDNEPYFKPLPTYFTDCSRFAVDARNDEFYGCRPSKSTSIVNTWTAIVLKLLWCNGTIYFILSHRAKLHIVF